MKNKKEEITDEDLLRIPVKGASEKYSPLNWAFVLWCIDETYYDVKGVKITTLITSIPIRDVPIEVMKLGDLRVISELGQTLKEIVDEMDSLKRSDDTYVLMEEFAAYVTPFRTGRRYWAGDAAYLSKCYMDESTGEPTEIIPNDFWTAFKLVIPEEKRKELQDESVEDVLLDTDEGRISVTEDETRGTEMEE